MIHRRLVIAIVLCAGACEEQPAIAPGRPALATMPDGSAWRNVNGSESVATPPADADPELAAAIAQARSTAHEAGRRWASVPEADRARWAVKWPAPTADGGVEHVWVRPTSWSRHRIEGWLASPPQSELLCGRVRGQLVSFPAEALSDWARFAEDATDDPVEGGFTIRVLAARYGKPRH